MYNGIPSFPAVATFQRPSYIFSESSRVQQLVVLFSDRAIATPLTFQVSEGKVAGHYILGNWQCMMIREIWREGHFANLGFISFLCHIR